MTDMRAPRGLKANYLGSFTFPFSEKPRMLGSGKGKKKRRKKAKTEQVVVQDTLNPVDTRISSAPPTMLPGTVTNRLPTASVNLVCDVCLEMDNDHYLIDCLDVNTPQLMRVIGRARREHAVSYHDWAP